MIICIYDVIKYGSCMIDDVLFDMLDDYNFDMLYDNSFEMIFWNYFHSHKKDCADRPFEIIYISISGQHNLWKQFVMFYVLIWYMTFISKWAMCSYLHFEMLYDCHFEMRGQNFRPQNYFRQKNRKYFIDENTL